MIPANIDDYRTHTRRRLARFLIEYTGSGVLEEQTQRNNTADLQTITVRQRVLRNAANIALTTELLGEKLATPLILSPVGIAGLNARRGEVLVAQAAE